MNTAQLTVAIGNHCFPVFLQRGFFHTAPGFTALHKHRYTEIHLVCGGKSEYLVGERRITVHPGQALGIPPGTFHQCCMAEPQTMNTAFQLSVPLDTPFRKYLPQGINTHLMELIEENADPGKISATIALIYAELFDCTEPLTPLRDPAFIIHEKLANEYATDLTLSDLAEELKLSKKQTERLIVKYTGHSFRTELTRRRMEAARHLIETEDISLAEAAERVGYKSYSGFWKAFHGEQK